MHVLDELDRVGAVILGKHFCYQSEKHGSGYIMKDAIYPYPSIIGEICSQLVKPFWDEGIEVVAGPALGGIILASQCADGFRWPGGRDRLMVWAEKDGDDFVFKRATFPGHLNNKRLLVVEDILTTGGSVAKVCRVATLLGAEVVGVSAIVNRGGVTAADIGVSKLETLEEVNFDAVEPDDCYLCAQNVPMVTNIGHGAEYQVAHPDYPGGFTQLEFLTNKS